jgi:hypothetical protein
MGIRHFLAKVFALILVGLMGEGRAEAAPITYTESVIGTGWLGQTPFTNALVTFTSYADTDQVSAQGSFGAFAVINHYASVSVAGLNTAMFYTETSTFVSGPGAGLGAGSFEPTLTINGPVYNNYQEDIFDVSNAPFNKYNLKSSIGPVSGTALFNAYGAFNTSAGYFSLASTSGNPTFQAISSAPTTAPEPSSLILFGVLSASLAVPSLRRSLVRRRASEPHYASR